MFDKNGWLRVPNWQDNVEKVEIINFSGAEPRYQLVLKTGGPIFEAIKDHLLQENGDLRFDPSEIHSIKLLIGGKIYQKFHQDICAKKGVSEDTIAPIREECNSVLLTCDLGHPCKLCVDPSAAVSSQSWDDIVEHFKSCETTPSPQVLYDDDRTIISGFCLIFDGGVHHAGAPCLTSTCSFAKLVELAYDGKSWRPSLTKAHLTSIPRLSTICRLFISTWAC